ncbi:hypothetical protein DYB25_000254 [Aphanomyces astaci]|uniref:Cilia- and flagella-associated protein 157 n=1 Tax=Aphanomyces astaci TaxID=112090 RepID=A0A397EPI8_APHAT|nr:hypothetical protein DYB25_000254 [Aphanomyces astaci]RHY07673.1 hypothetical protein DYB36_000858 [Aphanomyces astaci]RHY61696.1 hypothetical protein DYB30_000491 [Aphanomyces astaci]RHY74305.1 hypothetical protein DYB38_000014 [Aphanomyces astaci]RHY74373.1 hypothetical protein DYB34_000093 [Aphanomyces astaci]
MNEKEEVGLLKMENAMLRQKVLMRKDIHVLQTILKKEGLKNEIDKEIFTKIIKDDRDRYRHQVMELTDRIKRLEREKYDMFLWAKQNQDHCLLEMRKLTRALIKAKKMADEQVRSPLACVSVAFTSMYSRTTARNCMSW